ncbi:putative integral membrane protein [Lachnospiraceae bacterium TWA4]|nr:putative integral membrane protein [Lachnospiraceae bacterium TWA4]
MPIGIILNVTCVVIGGIIGTFIGPKLTDTFKEHLNTIFGVCAMAMGISSIVLMQNMPIVILSIIVGTVLGLAIHLGDNVQKAGLATQKLISTLIPSQQEKSDEFKSVLVTAIVLFCASGTGIYGSMVLGMTGDNNILIAKSILDLPTALIFACVLGAITCIIAIPQFIIFLILFFLANAIYPFCTDVMINDFKACGGILLLATGFRMAKIKEFPIADMIPAMVLVMPLSSLWTSFILPLIS